MRRQLQASKIPRGFLGSNFELGHVDPGHMLTPQSYKQVANLSLATRICTYHPTASVLSGTCALHVDPFGDTAYVPWACSPYRGIDSSQLSTSLWRDIYDNGESTCHWHVYLGRQVRENVIT